MNTTYLILLILVIIYIPTYILVRKSEWAKSKCTTARCIT